MPKGDDAYEGFSPGPRFPALRVTACGVGLLVAVYVWAGWGFAWDVTPGDLVRGGPPVGFGGWEGRYVRVRGRPYAADTSEVAGWRLDIRTGEEYPQTTLAHRTVLVDPDAGGGGHKILVRSRQEIWADIREEDVSLEDRPERAVRGRVVRINRQLAVDATLARVNGVGLIGAVVAFWSAVFMYLWFADWRRAVLRDDALRGAEDHAGVE